MGNKSSEMPPCFIRVDVAHCIKLISQWDCLRKQRPRVREFYIRAMAQLLQSQSMEDARDRIRSIVIVASSETEGNDDSGLPVISETCKTQLKRRIAEGCVHLPSIQEDDLEVKTIDPLHTDMSHTTELKRWVTDICDEGKMLAVVDGDRDNLQFLPGLVPHVIRMACYLPLWTGIMVPHFQSNNSTASSAHVEAEFNNIKNGLFKHENLPTRVDRFIIRHLGYIEGNMRLSTAAVNMSANSEKNIPKSTECEESTADHGSVQCPDIHTEQDSEIQSVQASDDEQGLDIHTSYGDQKM